MNRDPVPFVDLARLHDPIAAQLQTAIARVLERGDFVLGRELERFEAAFATAVGCAHCVGVGSGTAALHLATLALELEPGAEVIVPAHTHISSALGPLHAGVTPVFCDVDRDSGLIDLDSAAQVLGPHTAAILAVDLYGQACDAEAVAAFASRHGLALIEDAAQAQGARWGERPCGSLGDVAAFSFYPSKPLGALGDGGAITTDDPALADRARTLRDLGQPPGHKGEHERAGFSDRLDTIQAAVLSVKLEGLEQANDSCRAAAARYREHLPGAAIPLTERPAGHDVHHLFPVRLADRNAAAVALADRRIGTGLHYSPALHRQPPFAGSRPRTSLGRAERWAAEELSLPMFAGITGDEVDAVCEALADHLGAGERARPPGA